MKPTGVAGSPEAQIPGFHSFLRDNRALKGLSRVCINGLYRECNKGLYRACIKGLYRVCLKGLYRECIIKGCMRCVLMFWALTSKPYTMHGLGRKALYKAFLASQGRGPDSQHRQVPENSRSPTNTYSLQYSSFFLVLTQAILRILKDNPKKELQWRLQVLSETGCVCWESI